MSDSTDYPPERIVSDIFALSQEIETVGLDSSFSASTNRKGYSTASVSVFDSDDTVFFKLALYGYGDTKELNELYDALHALLLERKGAPEINF